MSNIVKSEGALEIWQKANVPSEIWSALKSSLYPGAKDESVLMVWDYCKAGKLDPLQKPVHIVPMWIVDKKTNSGEMRDVVMPGIGLYRIQASRSGMHVGTSEPEFGPDITMKLGSLEVTFPEWCKVVVKKFVHGHIAEFPAKEYWLENYANSGKDKVTKAVKLEPNEMWRKRQKGQLAKCAEAQALRKAFPDHVSQAPTAEEMEGKTLDEANFKDITPKGSKADELANLLGAANEKIPSEGIVIDSTATSHGTTIETRIMDVTIGVPASPEKVAELKGIIKEHDVPKKVPDFWLDKAGVATLDELPADKIDQYIQYIYSKYPI